jgi:hypothetical protein
VTWHPTQKVEAALRRMGFDPTVQAGSFVRFLRFTSAGELVVIILDSSEEVVEEQHLVRSLPRGNVDLAEFWNHFDVIPD